MFFSKIVLYFYGKQKTAMKQTITLFFLLFCKVCFAQINLVPNPSFEDTVSCPNANAQVYKAKYWHILDNTPDYFHECCVVPNFSIPNNQFTYQYAATGDAYCGLYTWWGNGFYREIIGSFLIAPLILQTKYYLNFKVNFATKPPPTFSTLATNKIGMLLSTVDYLSNPPPYNNFAHLYADSIITDTVNWITIRGSLIADSAYSFISIGNFFDNANTDTLQYYGSPVGAAYYVVDDICLSTDSMYCETWTGIPEDVIKENIKIIPNPAIDNLEVENIPYGCKEILLYDVALKVLKRISINRNFKIITDISNFKEGIYSILFIKKDNSYVLKKFIKLNN